MKKGRKPLASEVKKQRILEKFWNSLGLDLRVLEEFQLFNQYYPESKQIFVKQPILIKREKKRRVRFVQKHPRDPLIDCRTIRTQEREKLEKQEEKYISQQNQQDSFISQNDHVSFISSQKQYDSFISSGLSLINDQINNQEKTNTEIQVPALTRNPPRYLQFEPSPPSSPSLSIMQPLTKSFVQKLMDDDDLSHELNWSLSNISILPQSVEQATFAFIKDKFPSTNEKQYERLLQAYGHNYQIIQTLIKTNPKQIKTLLEKYQKM